MIQNTISKFSKTKKKLKKRTPKVKKIKNIHEELSNQKVGIIIQNTILVWFGLVWDLLLLKRGLKAPRRARMALGPEGPPSSPQELEGLARSAQIF